MFTGIVEAVGSIVSNEPGNGGMRLVIGAGQLDLSDVHPGDSIAVNGVCLTTVALGPGTFTVDVSAETLRCTAGFDTGMELNLEKAMRLSDRLGGHIVAGHVDGVGEVVAFEPVGECMRLAIRAPDEIARFVAVKGSVTVDGVSLTVNRVAGNDFDMNLIPHTLAHTNLGRLSPGSRVNLEADLLARYAFRILSYGKDHD